MLAIQRPRTMGSTQPPDVNLPFGYSFDPSQEMLFTDPPPEPAPGQPLLSDNDTKLLSSFFEDMTANNYNTTSFGEGLNFSDEWLNLPPQFMGTATSFGQQPSATLESPVHGLHPGSFHDLIAPTSTLMPPPPPPHAAAQQHSPVEQHATADVLAAATLLQNGSMSRANGGEHDSLFMGRDIQAALGSPVGPLRHQPIADFRQDERRMSQPHMTAEHDNTFTDMMFGSAARTVAQRFNQPVEVQWGSDANFGRHNFMPHSEKETSEALLQERLEYMTCLEVNASAATTRPSSPIHNGTSHAASPPYKLKTATTTLVKQEEDPDAPPRKRRKSKAKDDAEDDEDELVLVTASRSQIRKRKSKAEAPSASSPVSNETPGRRRKSAANNASKQPRENLSEEQKRENHIKSEQKRRTLIKEGFDDLCELVPGLRGGGFSKSTMLSMAAEWLEDVLKGNDVLKAQLAALEGK